MDEEESDTLRIEGITAEDLETLCASLVEFESRLGCPIPVHGINILFGRLFSSADDAAFRQALEKAGVIKEVAIPNARTRFYCTMKRCHALAGDRHRVFASDIKSIERSPHLFLSRAKVWWKAQGEAAHHEGSSGR